MILQTGGFALGETSTRSRPCSEAASRASALEIIPIWLPSGSITRTSFARIASFILVRLALDPFVRFGKAILSPPPKVKR
jgi:hypothetical protein